MKFEIMTSILFELLSKKCVSAKYLAEKYEVSTRSIYRYIDELDRAGVPLYSVQGKQGGFSLMDTYKLSSTFLTKAEFNKAVESLSALNEGVFDKVLQSVILKLKATVKNEYGGFDVKSGNLIIDAGPWGDAVGYKSKLSLMQKCIEENVIVTISYHDRNGNVSSRDIEPHVIVFKQGLWYVYAYCRKRNDFRFFKIGRIELANAKNEKFARRELKKDDLPLNWHESVPCEYVELLVSPAVLSDVEEWLGVENVCKVNGKYIASARLPYDKGLVSKIMSFSKNIKVLSPEKLKKEVLDSAKEILKNY